MSEADKKTETRRAYRLEKEIEIAASFEEVWRALTDARELANWFPLEARVTPGKDGKIFLSWGPECQGEADIVAWEAPKRFAWREKTALVEFTLEVRAGKTLVRLVQSGFFSGADWENEWFESTNYGWEFMLLSLRVLFERHRGQERKVIWLRQPVALTRVEAYRKLLGPDGLFREGVRPSSKPYAAFVLNTRSGQEISGFVEMLKEPRGICLRVTEWNDALFWVTLEGADGKLEAQIWISTFGVPQSSIEVWKAAWANQLKTVLH
jgi:uncharacterized protein YndB with AHSA1/START domain